MVDLPRPAVPYMVAAAVCGLGLLIPAIFLPWEEDASFLLFLLAVILASWYGGLWPALGASALGTIGMAYVDGQIGPPNTLFEIVTEGLAFLAVAVPLSVASTTVRRIRRRAELDRVNLEREKLHVAELEELSTMKSRFISMASHELRTPMNKVRGFAELALADTPPGDDRRPLLAAVHDEANRLAVLVDNVLDVSQIEGGGLRAHVAPVDLEHALRPLVESVAASAPDHDLALEVSPSARWAQADAPKLQRIVTNLLDNAVKYSPGGGTIHLSVRPSADPGRVDVEVRDAGIGFPPDDVERIFQCFGRSESAIRRGIPGTGLGLHIVKELVALHGGTIVVESAPERGSTFRFTLAAAEPPARRPVANSSQPPSPGSGDGRLPRPTPGT